MSFGTSGTEFQPTSDPHLHAIYSYAHFMRGPALYEKDYIKDYTLYTKLYTRLYKYFFDSAVQHAPQPLRILTMSNLVLRGITRHHRRLQVLGIF